MDMLSVLGRQFHTAQELVRLRTARNANAVIEEESSFGERIADSVASFGGSWSFIITSLTILVIYAAINVILGQSAWDPYPFILLNLILSMLAAIQAPVIMMSQNRQDKKDRVRSELDFEVNRRAEAEIQSLALKLNVIVDKIDDVHEHLQSSTRLQGRE
jgi:CRP/FNR family transcriptional regulator, cyclic AMP receptor protein